MNVIICKLHHTDDKVKVNTPQNIFFIVVHHQDMDHVITYTMYYKYIYYFWTIVYVSDVHCGVLHYHQSRPPIAVLEYQFDLMTNLHMRCSWLCL